MRQIFRTAAALVLAASASQTAGDQPEAANGDAASVETVVLLHGLGRTKAAMWVRALRMEKAGFNVIRVGYQSLRDPPEAILADVAEQVLDCCKALPAPVHFVGHSLGGLLIRAFLAEHRPGNLGRVVLIGTPNNGTPLADRYRDSWWMKLAGPAATTLGTGSGSFPRSLPDPDYPTGIIAGRKASGPLPDVIAGDDDGLVPVASTKLPGMTDFIIVESGHTSMRYSDDVAHQAIAFLRNGAFEHENE